MKKCRWCGEVLPLSAFAKHGRRYRHRSECKLCRKQRRAELDDGALRVKPWTRAGVYSLP